jgi:hypothetical protein
MESRIKNHQSSKKGEQIDALNLQKHHIEKVMKTQEVIILPKDENTEKSKIRSKKDDLKRYIRVGTDYFRISSRLNKYGFRERVLLKWKKETIKDDFGTKSNPKPYLNLPKFIGFCNKPNNLDYKRIHNKHWNIYEPLTYSIEEGECPHTLDFLRHIFGEKYEVGLDYITILYRHPTQILPILCLVSRERNTGKSTFLKWLQAIFQQNMAIIPNENIQKNFNAHYINKLIIAIDETYIGLEKKEIAERIKKMATDDKAFIEFKGRDSEQIDYFAKIIMCSNNETDFIQIEEQEIRYFVNKVKPFSKESQKYDLLERYLIPEIPHFLHTLKTREITHPQKSRAWFDDAIIRTEALEKVMKDTRPAYQIAIDDFLEDCFLTFDVKKLEFQILDIFSQLKDKVRLLDMNKLKKYFYEKGYEPSYPKKFHLYNLESYQITANPESYTPSYKTGRCLTFFREDWVREELEKVQTENKEQIENQIKVMDDEPPF